MQTTNLNSMKSNMKRVMHALVASLFLSLVAACGGGGVVPGALSDVRPLPSDFQTRKAVNYSPYRTTLAGVNNKPTAESSNANFRANIEQDLQLLMDGKFTLIRLFDSSTDVSKVVLDVIKAKQTADPNFNMRVMLGVWIDKSDTNFNQLEIARGVKLANDYKDIVLAVSVGNETMVSWNTWNPVPPATMLGYIQTVRSQIKQPVTTDDNWAFFAKNTGEINDPKKIVNAIDFVSVHTYTLADSLHSDTKWDWKQLAVPESSRAAAMMQAAVAGAKADVSAVRTYLDGIGLTQIPIIIGETGWKAEASNGEFYRAHPANQKKYFDGMSAWLNSTETAKPKAIFTFAAFDEPWKGSDDKWGLFTVERKARYAVHDLYPAGIREPLPADAAAVFYPDTANVKVSTNRFTLLADATNASEVRLTNFDIYGWDTPANAYGYVLDTPAGAAYEGSNYLKIVPSPNTSSDPGKNYGWGLFFKPKSNEYDLSEFANGTLNFRIKTTYQGKLEFGFLTGSGSTGYDVYVALTSGQYGYSNDGAWHQVSIPMSVLRAAGAPSYGNSDTVATFNLQKVTQPFVVADRYSKTSNTRFQTTEIGVDEIYWSK